MPVGVTTHGSHADLEAALSVAAFGAVSGEPIALDQLWDMLDAAAHYREQVGRVCPPTYVALVVYWVKAGLASPFLEGPLCLSMYG